MPSQQVVIKDNIVTPSLSDGVYIVTQPKETRRTRANSYYWFCLNILEKNTNYGYFADEWHEIFKLNFNGYSKGTRRFGQTTTKLSVSEFYVYVNKCLAFGELNDIKFPDPTLYKLEKWIFLKKQ